MKNSLWIVTLLFFGSILLADTPPPNKARLYDGTGATAITATGSSINANITNASLPLPTGASTSAKQPALGVAGTASSDVLTVQGIANMTAFKVDGSGVTQPVSASSWPLPTGAATSALQTTGNSSLSTIATNTGNIPPLGQALAGASVPVVLTAAQLTTLTPLSTVTANEGGTWSVRAQDGSGNALTSVALSGSKQALDVAIRNSGGTQVDPTQIRALTSSDQVTVANASLAVTQSTGTNLHTVVDSGSIGVTNLPTTVDTGNGSAGASTLRAALADDVVVTGPSAQTTSNNILVAGGAASSCASYRSVSVQINSTATGGTLIFEGSNDNSNFFSIVAADGTTAGATAPIVSYTPAAANRLWQLPCNVAFFRIRTSVTLTGGSVQAIARFSTMPYLPLSNTVQQNTAASLAVSATQSTAASTANGWPVKPTDGTTVITVKAASTAAAAADTSMVVEQAPNGGNPCQNPSATLVSITGATSGTAATQIIALSGSTKIYICSLTVIGVSGTNPTFSLVQGTGSNCAASQATVLQAWGTTAGSLYAFAKPVAVGVAGDALCYLDGGTTPIQNYAITYVQQ